MTTLRQLDAFLGRRKLFNWVGGAINGFGILVALGAHFASVMTGGYPHDLQLLLLGLIIAFLPAFLWVSYIVIGMVAIAGAVLTLTISPMSPAMNWLFAFILGTVAIIAFWRGFSWEDVHKKERGAGYGKFLQ